MIMTGEAFLGKEPFKDVLVHATVNDEDGRRMSKSLGTGVDPVELIRLYGADATRFGLIMRVTETQDIRFKLRWKSGGKRATGPDDALARAEQIEEARNFCNKLWNISRFVLMSLGDAGDAGDAGDVGAVGDPNAAGGTSVALRPLESFAGDGAAGLELADRWILSRFAAAAQAVNDAVDRYALGDASWTLYHFLWDEFADWYVELAKPRLRGDARAAQTVREVLLAVLEASLRLAHPFVPFITEELWQALPARTAGAAAVVAAYPGAYPALRDEDAERRMAATIEIARAVRTLKAEAGIPQRTVDVSISPAVHAAGAAAEAGGKNGSAPAAAALAAREVAYVEQSARCRVVSELPGGPALHGVAAGYAVAVAVGAGIDAAAERARLQKELDGVQQALRGAEAKLANQQFVTRAPAAVVEQQRRLRDDLLARIATLQERLRRFGDQTVSGNQVR
jgi:valyl-tRNA synthetase